jgi:hypothetical protein
MQAVLHSAQKRRRPGINDGQDCLPNDAGSLPGQERFTAKEPVTCLDEVVLPGAGGNHGTFEAATTEQP